VAPSAKLLADVAALRRLDRLPGTGRELATIRSIFGAGRTRLFTAEAATERAVYGAGLRDAAVIAFATHGLTPADAVPSGASATLASEVFQLAEPGLVLTPPAEASEADDGFLTASEVATLDLDADWVILSACNTATGDADSEGLSQLARAFFFAGARNLLASHWPVDDDVAARLTSRTLMLERTGLTRAEAFRRAMAEIRNDRANDAKASWAHPFFWAPFVLIGEGG
jgi:CHAT domain-containing protein